MKPVKTTKIWHGWFSLEAARNGIAKYRSITGDIVDITEVTENDKPDGKFSDFVYVGEVLECVKPKDLPTMPRTKAEYDDLIRKKLTELKYEALGSIKVPRTFTNLITEKASLQNFDPKFRWN